MIQESASAQKKKMVIKEVFFVNLLLLFVVNLFLRVKLLLQVRTSDNYGHRIRSIPMIDAPFDSRRPRPMTTHVKRVRVRVRVVKAMVTSTKRTPICSALAMY